MSVKRKAQREAIRISRCGCSHCKKRVELLVSEETCPDSYRCPMCKTQWIFVTNIEMDGDDLLAALQLSLEAPTRCTCEKCKLSDAKYAALVHVWVEMA